MSTSGNGGKHARDASSGSGSMESGAEEWAATAEDVLWRRTKCGLHMTPAQREAVAEFMKGR